MACDEWSEYRRPIACGQRKSIFYRGCLDWDPTTTTTTTSWEAAVVARFIVFSLFLSIFKKNSDYEQLHQLFEAGFMSLTQMMVSNIADFLNASLWFEY